MDRKMIVIDCDPGTDDTMAIFMALSAPNIDVVAITTVVGNTGLEYTNRNVLRALKMCNRLDVVINTFNMKLYDSCELELFDNR